MNESESNNDQRKHEFAIELNGVLHQYPDSNVRLQFEPWKLARTEHVFLFGDSGSGKSTLLNLLSGILKPQAGEIRLFGHDICGFSNRARDKFRSQHIGVVFQQFNLIPYLSVLQNIKLAAYFGRTSIKNIQPRIEHLLSELKLDKDVLHSKVSQLSVGQRQRVAIVRALANSPGLLLVDEPTSALDASARDAFMNLLLKIAEEQGTTMIFVSHDEKLKDFFTTRLPIGSLLREHCTCKNG